MRYRLNPKTEIIVSKPNRKWTNPLQARKYNDETENSILIQKTLTKDELRKNPKIREALLESIQFYRNRGFGIKVVSRWIYSFPTRITVYDFWAIKKD